MAPPSDLPRDQWARWHSVPFAELWRLRNNPVFPTSTSQMVEAYWWAFDAVFRALAYRDVDGPCFCESQALPHKGWIHAPLCLDIRRSLGVIEGVDSRA